MKPLKLIIEGVNSFIAPQEIDFEVVGADNIFCVSGPTGSGKTTILDCIILSLYERPMGRGNLGDFINLKCKRAIIDFTFELCGDVYRSRRTIERNRAGSTLLIKNGQPYLEGKEAFAHLGEKIGLTAAEFTNVVVLQQGEFARFLKSGKSERITLIINLFGLHRFFGLDKKFREKAKSLSDTAAATARSVEQYNELNEEYFTARKIELGDVNKAVTEHQKQADELRKKAVDIRHGLDKYEQYKKDVAALAEADERLVKRRESYKRGEEAKRSVELRDAELKTAESGRDGLIKRRTELESLDKACERVSALKTDLAAEEKDAAEQSASLSAMTARLREERTALLSAEKAVSAELEKIGIPSSSDRKIAVTAALERAKAALGELNRLTCQFHDEKNKLDDLTAALALAQAEWQAFSAALGTHEEAVNAALAALNSARVRYDRAAENNALALVTEALKTGDTCPVCGGKIHSLERVGTADLTALKAELASREAELKAAEEKAKKAGNSAAAATEKVQSLTAQLTEREKTVKLAEAAVKAINEAELTDRLNALYALSDTLTTLEEQSRRADTLEGEVKVVELKLNGVLRSAEDKKKQIAEYNGPDDRDKIREGIADINKSLADMEQRRADVNKELQRCVDGLSELNRQITELETKCAALIDATKTAVPAITAEDAAAAEKLAEEANEAYLSLFKRQAELTTKLGMDEENYAYKLDVLRRIDEITKEATKYQELEALFKQNAFTEFVAAEYIKAFTAVASVKLSELTAGKYSMGYGDDGEFYVLDFLSGNEKRGVKTLSGGETFLASLALAIAISKELSQNKNFDFFFVDEGFGTLSQNAIDMVTSALYELSRDTLVGVITHRDELKERIPAAVVVECATEDEGSKVTYRQ